MRQPKLKKPDNEIILIIGLPLVVIVFFCLIFFKIPIAIQSALISAGISWLITSQRNKTQLVFDLHKEFNSTELYQARRKAEIFLNNINREKKHEKILNFEEIYKQYKEEESRAIWLVVRFYERLWLAIDNNQVDLKLTAKLFGQTFNWWYKHYFKHQLVTIENSQAGNNIKNLRHWMDNNFKETKNIEPTSYP
ncbi:MAG: hypothetical protein AB4206_04125 [Xenococcaceae cyanobacterium]